MNAYLGQMAENFRQRLVAEGVSTSSAEKICETYLRIVHSGVAPRAAEKLLRPQVMRTLLLQVLTNLEGEFAEKNPRTPSEDVRAAFAAARDLVHRDPRANEETCTRCIQRVLWLRRRERKSPLAAALVEAQLVK